MTNADVQPPATILVVEDEILIRAAVAGYLRDCGYHVLEAGAVDEAQTILDSDEPVDILFADVELGAGASGFVLASWARQKYPAVRVLLTSGVARMAEKADDLCDGPFLAKPYSHERLAQEIKRLLGRADKA
ncbi:MAG TPA: response regulator [Reyranella sp.]|jgi:DNA-binding NtrC family response regulator|nr:response regulator [Reyranella sp.]